MKWLTVALATLLLAGALCNDATAQIRVGSLDDSRADEGYTLNGSVMVAARAKLLNPANFGPSGTASPSIQITDTAATIDASVLANFDVLFIGWLANGTLSGTELTAIQTWVNGGGTVIATCDDTSHVDICVTFSHSLGGTSVPPVVPTGAGLSEVMGGLFGTASSVEQAGNYSYFADTTGATVLGVDSAGVPNPVIMVQSFGAGRVIFVGDVDMISSAVSSGDGISSDNDRLLANLFAFAGGAVAGAPAAPLEPVDVPALDARLLVGLGLLLVALAAISRRRPRMR